MMKLNSRSLKWGSRTYIMGILNITPDSFSGDGLIEAQENHELDAVQVTEHALKLAKKFISEGADIIDIGGESTRPGSEYLGLDEELERVIPVLRAISAELDTIISIDTYKSQVAEAAIESGAHMVNDVWGLRADPDLAEVVAEHGVPVILMHNRSSWVHTSIKERLGGRYVGVPYENLIEDIKKELMESVGIAVEAGIAEDRIILDPGIGFGKTVEQNLELLNRLNEIRELGFPLMIGPSRKSFIGYTLDLPPDERIEGTAAAIAVGISRGADIVRVHDVDYMSRVARMTDAIVRR
jgi:dihydropteroate synthase